MVYFGMSNLLIVCGQLGMVRLRFSALRHLSSRQEWVVIISDGMVTSIGSTY